LLFLDRGNFISPINYQGSLLIRSDNRGKGYFAASRNGRRHHQGVDLCAAIGTPVLASRSGLVVSATRNRGMGKYVIIRHKGNIITIYGHLSEIKVKKGEWVRQRAVIGAVGKTGNANNCQIVPHLHFEIRKNGVPQDPMEYISQ